MRSARKPTLVSAATASTSANSSSVSSPASQSRRAMRRAWRHAENLGWGTTESEAVDMYG